MSDASDKHPLEYAHREKQRSDEFRLLLAGLVTAFFVGFATSRGDRVLQDLFTARTVSQIDVIITIVSLALSILVGWYFGLRGFRDRFLKSTAVIEQLGPERSFTAIVQTLSLLHGDAGLQRARAAVQWAREELERRGDTPANRRELLEVLCQSKTQPEHPLQGHSWQQPLRVLHQNYRTVRSMCFAITPKVAEGQYQLFHELLDLLAPQELKIWPAPHSAHETAVEHKDYNDVFNQIKKAADQALRLAN